MTTRNIKMVAVHEIHRDGDTGREVLAPKARFRATALEADTLIAAGAAVRDKAEAVAATPLAQEDPAGESGKPAGKAGKAGKSAKPVDDDDDPVG